MSNELSCVSCLSWLDSNVSVSSVYSLVLMEAQNEN